MTDAELRALALKIAEGRVFGMWNVPQNLWLMVFMPLGWMSKRDLLKHKADTVYAIHGEDKAVPGRAINGYPMFAACRFLPRAHFDRVNALVDEVTAQRAAFLNTCRAFRPDHNGECLNCDEWADAHDEAAIRAGGPGRVCERCGGWFTPAPSAAGRYCSTACYRRKTPAAVFAGCVRAMAVLPEDVENPRATEKEKS